MYLHLPMSSGIAAVGAARLNVTLGTGSPVPDEVRWLLVGGQAVVQASIALLARTIQVADEYRPVYHVAGRVLFLSSFIVLLLGFTNLGTIPLPMVTVLLLLAPVF